MKRGEKLQCPLTAATVKSGLGRWPGSKPGGNKGEPGPLKHAHRAEVSLVAPSGRVSGLKGIRTDDHQF